MSKNIWSSVAITVALIFSSAIFGAESTWLLERNCNGTTIAGWGVYLNGECGNSDFGNPGYGTCSSSTFTAFDCRGSASCSSSSCTATHVTPLDVCTKDNTYYTCSTNDPDYSSFGSSYAVADVYSMNDCIGTPTTIVAGILNKCLNSPVSAVSSFSSVYITCSKDGVAQVTTYQQRDCQQPISSPLQINTNTCTDTHIYPPFSVSCYGV